MDWIERINNCFKSDNVLYSQHARHEMIDEEFGIVTDQEVYEAVCTGEVIESYPDDTPYPSVLIFGITHAGRPLHTVCAYNAGDDETIVITVYQPNPGKWDDGCRRRKK